MSNLNDIFFTPAANQELTYDQVLEDVQRYFAENHASTIAEAGEGNAERATSLLKELMEHYIVKRKYALDGLSTKELCSKLYEDMAGYSFLKKWIYKPGVEEVNINAYNDIEVIESSGRSIKIPDKFSSPQHAIDVIRRMLNACGMVIDDTMPSIVGFLDKNIRISVDKTPIVDADVGVNASIRIVNQQTVSEEKLLNSGSATAEMLHFLTACIRYGVSVCIAGSTGSGKTTIMAWLLSNVPNNRRLITIEEGSREFDLVKRDAQGNILNSVVHLLTRPSENPALNINQDFLLERVLRKHPDVIGVGEMRSAAESLSAAESSRTGHTVCTTIHSNSCNSTYINEPVKANFEAFVYEAELINANITSAINSLKMKIPNRVFHEWCGTLIQCQSDRSMKNTLPTINQKFSDVRVVQSELEAMMQGPRREAITMIFLVIANVPMLYFLNEDWFHTLIFTTPGKIALAICAAIILFALTQIMKLSKPIEYGGDSV